MIKYFMIKSIVNGFTYPFSPNIFFTVRGCENVHIYLWICKDIGWTYGNKAVGMMFGTLALAWIIVLVINHWMEKNYEDIYFIVPTFLWLFGNYLWMSGDLLYNSDVYRFTASCIMMVGLLLIVFYFAFLKKKQYFSPSNESDNKYVSNGLVCRFKSIGTWKRYEFIHMGFWLLKDYCWCSQDKIMWLAGAIPTLFISWDLINVTRKNQGLFVDLIHYISQLIWVCGNITWAFCELFSIGGDSKPNFNDKNTTGRFCAGIILLISWIPIICLYGIWLPLTVMKKITQEPGTEQTNSPMHVEIGQQDELDDAI